MTASNDGELEKMNAFSDVATINRYARRIEDAEASRLGVNLMQARRRLAIRLGVTPTTLENIRRLRTKIVPNWLMDRVKAEFISILHAEIQKLEHEIHIARQTGMDHREDDFRAAEAQLEAAKKILKL